MSYKLKEGHKGASELTDEEARKVAEELYESECEESRKTENPPEYVDGSESPASERVLSDLGEEDPNAEVELSEEEDA